MSNLENNISLEYKTNIVFVNHCCLLQPAAAHLALDASLVESFSVRRVHLGRVVERVNKYVSGVLKNFIQVSAMYMHSVHLSIELQENVDRQRMQHICIYI